MVSLWVRRGLERENSSEGALVKAAGVWGRANSDLRMPDLCYGKL